jgi:site-specific DNA-methyltransferase (adenine-specific)
VSVNKGIWDKSEGFDFVNNFNREWLTLVREKMKDDATIWISGTMHNIFSIGQLLTELGFKILNVISWEKTNPPPNFSCRYFTFSTEQIIKVNFDKDINHMKEQHKNLYLDILQQPKVNYTPEELQNIIYDMKTKIPSISY